MEHLKRQFSNLASIISGKQRKDSFSEFSEVSETALDAAFYNAPSGRLLCLTNIFFAQVLPNRTSNREREFFLSWEHVKYCYGISEAAVHGAATEGIITMEIHSSKLKAQFLFVSICLGSHR